MKFYEPRPPRQQVIVIQFESPLQDFRFIFYGQGRGWTESGREPRLVEFSTGIFLELRPERRHHVEGGMKTRKFLEYSHHTPVVLESVKPGPRQHIAARRRITILRLVHVPQHHQMDAVHRAAIPAVRLASVLE